MPKGDNMEQDQLWEHFLCFIKLTKEMFNRNYARCLFWGIPATELQELADAMKWAETEYNKYQLLRVLDESPKDERPN